MTSTLKPIGVREMLSNFTDPEDEALAGFYCIENVQGLADLFSSVEGDDNETCYKAVIPWSEPFVSQGDQTCAPYVLVWLNENQAKLLFQTKGLVFAKVSENLMVL